MSFSGNTFCVIAAGGTQNETAGSVELLTGDLGTRHIQNLPNDIRFPSMSVHNGTILLSGGSYYMFQKCLQLDHGIWKVHSEFDRTRTNPSLVTTETASFFFGGRFDSGTTFEYVG